MISEIDTSSVIDETESAKVTTESQMAECSTELMRRPETTDDSRLCESHFLGHSIVAVVVLQQQCSFFTCHAFIILSETGVTQEHIDEMRLLAENAMLSDMQNILNDGGKFDVRGRSGETPVMRELHVYHTYSIVL